MAKVSEISSYADKLLKVHAFEDYGPALNGLQVENDGTVSKIGAAVDSHLEVIERAVVAEVDFLVVHHGLYWTHYKPHTKSTYRKFRLMMDHNLAVYGSHLPLDAHPQLGNNAVLAKLIGMKTPKPFFDYKGSAIGLRGEMRLKRGELGDRLTKALGGEPILLPGGPERVRKIGVITGGAGNELAKVAAGGIDTFITGEASHWTYGLAYELGVNMFLGGHYRTEVYGVKALAEHLSKKFKVPWEFIDTPSGL